MATAAKHSGSHVSPQNVAALFDTPLTTGPGRGVSLQKQLLARLKHAILEGRLPAGARLPASRTLAEDLAVSRNTVSIVYDQLAAEGFIVAHRLGTRVAQLSLDPAISAEAAEAVRQRASAAAQPMAGATGTPAPPASRRIQRLPATRHAARADESPLPFTPGVPALTRFPASAWRRTLERVMREAQPRHYHYGDPLGEPALRDAIAAHLRISRGVRCDAAQVVITEGAHEALILCVRLLTDPGDTVWMEDPGYRGAKAAFHASDVRVQALRVDNEGVVIPEGLWARATPRLVYVTPSHQYPLGSVLSASRRLELIAQARQHGTWILEDDYDSEFRHQGEPIAAMQGMVPDAPVVYVGTFSKTMFPALRLGFLILPTALATQARDALDELLRGGHRFEQLALADFIRSGQFARHLGRMRRLYRERQAALRDALAAHFDPAYAVIGERCGLHLTVRLDPAFRDKAIVAAAQREGMGPRALSSFAIDPQPTDNGLVIGYGDTDASRIPGLIKRLAAIVAAQKNPA
ncbi:PLP-dependent aminotransferase family protein [Pandoraea nosoerga]|uniref:DNA-binding protein n=1 Tax=Pandoraea nosoerga TaxID=2508296 RepID=A0A5E4TZ52_9BURK|nr:PLP-dependent aminotransferase family protein [Pandoraea nosoerga]MBN4666621.1 PLP-dependent aminotransferase family protein [Pandoraea nosoerga]MBN4676794.1 PLP-dependent aminotransferase family protein [Pandoraea nosoerga]MBN4682606.1 PLP-dependent aminotransferase family protein [Pandoraea nosoerga]MBN4745796.1 PLP-dependent aminotransferase family protein [Pandoraea nosoerga]VVD92851.1 DNA-binding protein [Pandoraea nosoerga]